MSLLATEEEEGEECVEEEEEGVLDLSYLRSPVLSVQEFRRLCDMALCVEGQALPCHSQVMAQACRAVLDLCIVVQQQRGACGWEPPAEPRPAKRLRPADLRRRRRRNAARLLRVEEGMESFSIEEATLVLAVIYDPPRTAPVFAAIARRGHVKLLSKAVRLAAHLQAPRVLALADEGMASVLGPSQQQQQQQQRRPLLAAAHPWAPLPTAAPPPFGVQLVECWGPLLALADRHAEQLPRMRERGIRLAVRALSEALGIHAGWASDGQKVFAHPSLRALSPSTWAAITAGFLACTHMRLLALSEGGHAALGLQPEQVEGALQTCSLGIEEKGPQPIRWNWQPGYGVDDPRAKEKCCSKPFWAFGVQWQLFAFLNGHGPRNDGYLSVYVRALPSAPGARPARQADYIFAVKGTPNIVAEGSHLVAENGAGFPQMMTTEELAAGGYIKDGVVIIEAQLSNVRVLDLDPAPPPPPPLPPPPPDGQGGSGRQGPAPPDQLQPVGDPPPNPSALVLEEQAQPITA